MADREKVIWGWERCMKHTCPSIDSKEYADCEYTVGLYCRQDLLIDDTIALLKEQDETIKELQNAYGYLQKQFFEVQDELLKEQEGMLVEYSVFDGIKYGGCPRCNARIDNLVNPKACGYCGQVVKWNA